MRRASSPARHARRPEDPSRRIECLTGHDPDVRNVPDSPCHRVEGKAWLNHGNIDACNRSPFPQPAPRSVCMNGAAVELPPCMSTTRTTKRGMYWKENCISATMTERRWRAQEGPFLFLRRSEEH